jgi:hypothetical protein
MTDLLFIPVNCYLHYLLKLIDMKRSVCILGVILLLFPVSITAQKSKSDLKKKITVSGLITGEDNKPVADAEIYVDSLTTGELTDGLGKYKIKISPYAKIIIAISAEHGYGQAVINENETINIKLNGDTKNLAVFQAKNTKMIPREKNERARRINTYTDIYQMIRQEVPGVVVSGRSIVVQQQNSFFGSSQPLFVVNGVRVNNIDNINPLEVKSIQLLKGSYSNIYGNDGANGVISITLKSGSDK